MRLFYTGQFKKDYKRIRKQNKDTTKLQKIIKSLVAGEALGPKYRNHKLVGNWKNCYDCHIEPDWLLIYKKESDCLILVRTGSHSELFSK